MGTTPRRTQELGSLAYTCVILVGATFWSWAMAVPRALTKATMRMLDTFEDAMLNILWDYQGENILRFLYEHQQSAAKGGNGDGAAARVCVDGKMLCARVAGSSRSVAMQTDDCAMSLGVREREKRNKLMDKILEDLVPALLQVLHSIPQRSEMEAMYREQIALIQNVQQSAYAGPLLLTSDNHNVCGSDDDQQESALAGHADIGQALQGLAERMGAVDEHVVQVLRALESEAQSSTLVDERLRTLVEGLSAVREKCEADRTLALHMKQCLERIDSTLASAITAAEPKTHSASEQHQPGDDAQATLPAEHSADCNAYPSFAYSGRNAISSCACSAQYNSDDDYGGDCMRPAIVEDDVSCASNTRAQSRAASVNDTASVREVGDVASIPNQVDPKKIAADPAPIQISKCETSDVTLPRAESILGSAVAEDYEWLTTDAQLETPGTGLGLTASKDDAAASKAHTTGRVRRKFSLRREIKRHSWFGKKPE